MADLHSPDMRISESAIEFVKAVYALPPDERAVCERLTKLFTNNAFCAAYTIAGDIPFKGLTAYMDAWEAEHKKQ